MNSPSENYGDENENEAQKIPITDEQLIDAFEFFTQEIFEGNPMNAYLDLVLSGAKVPSILIYDEVILPSVLRAQLDDFACMEEFQRRRELVMNHFLEKILQYLKEQLRTDDDLAALDSLTVYDFERGIGAIQALIFLIKPETFPAIRRLYVNEISDDLPPVSMERDPDAPVPTPEEGREAMLSLLMEVVRNRLTKYILSKR